MTTSGGTILRILRQGRIDHPRRPSGQARTAQSKAANLLDRLEDYDLPVLAFLIDPAVPLTNNQGEQDIRMIKVKQKISGCFRTLAGAQVFARVRSYLSTCRKQGHNLWDACYRLAIGQPFMPHAPAAAPDPATARGLQKPRALSPSGCSRTRNDLYTYCELTSGGRLATCQLMPLPRPWGESTAAQIELRRPAILASGRGGPGNCRDLLARQERARRMRQRQ